MLIFEVKALWSLTKLTSKIKNRYSSLINQPEQRGNQNLTHSQRILVFRESNPLDDARNNFS
jgi:hypothetical protein